MSNNNKQLHKKDKSFDASFASGPLILAEASKNLSVSKYAGKILHAGYVTMETINKKFWQKAWTKKYLVLTQSALDVFPDMEAIHKKSQHRVDIDRYTKLMDIDNYKGKAFTFGIKQGQKPTDAPAPKESTGNTYWFHGSSSGDRENWANKVTQAIEDSKKGAVVLKTSVVKLVESNNWKEVQRLVQESEYNVNAKVYLYQQYVKFLKEKGFLDKKPSTTVTVEAPEEPEAPVPEEPASASPNTLGVELPTKTRGRSLSSAYVPVVASESEALSDEVDDSEMVKYGFTHMDSLLHLACHFGHPAMVKMLIAKGAEVNSQNSQGRSPLHYVLDAKDGAARMECIKELLAAKIDVNLCDVNQMNALLVAARAKDWSVVHVLLQAGALCNVVDTRDDNSSLHEAVKEGQLDIVNEMLKQTEEPVEVDAKNKEGDSAMEIASSQNRLDILKALMIHSKGEITSDWTVAASVKTFLPLVVELGYLKTLQDIVAAVPDTVNYTWSFLMVERTTLTHAIDFKHVELVQFLVQQSNIDVNKPEVKEKVKYTPLHKAFMSGIEAIMLAVAEKANVSVTSGPDEALAYLLAIKYNAPESVKNVLLPKTLEANNFTKEEELLQVKTKTGLSLVHLASESNDVKMLEYLVGKNIFDLPTLMNEKNQGVLSSACEKGNLDAAKYLIEVCKLDPLGTQKEHYIEGSYPPLHCACLSGNVDLVQYLVEQANVSVDYSRREGQMKAILLSSLHGKLDIVNYLIEKNANTSFGITISGDANINALMLASGYGHVQVVESLVDKGKMDVLAVSSKGVSALDFAVKRSQFKVMKALIARNAANPDQLTQLAIQYGDLSIAENK